MFFTGPMVMPPRGFDVPPEEPLKSRQLSMPRGHCYRPSPRLSPEVEGRVCAAKANAVLLAKFGSCLKHVRTLSSPPRGPRVEFTSATSPLRARAALESAAFQSVTRLHKHVWSHSRTFSSCSPAPLVATPEMLVCWVACARRCGLPLVERTCGSNLC